MNQKPKPGNQKTASNKGGTLIQKPPQQQFKKGNKKPQQQQQQKGGHQKKVQAFSGQGVKVDSDNHVYNWICPNCGYINKTSCDEKCRICQYIRNQEGDQDQQQ